MQSSPGSSSEGGQVHDVPWGLVGTLDPRFLDAGAAGRRGTKSVS